LQRNEEVSGLFGIQWTPVALLVNKDRRIASKVAAGDASIRALLERISRAQEAYFIVDEDSGVVVGQSIPDFELPKLDEGKISSREFLGRKTLLTYWSPTCGFCNEMLEDLKGWNRNKGADDPELVIISASKDAGEKIKADFDSLILIDEKHQLLGKLGMQGTPSAVLIDEGGRIISEVAVGAQKIWELLGVRKNGHFEI
jgi:peroxiredoxin